MNRLIPYKSYSYERDLIEYAGCVINDPANTPAILAYTTPGISVSRVSTGLYQINLTDKVPLYSQILNHTAVPSDLSCIDAGFASSCMIWANAFNNIDVVASPTTIVYSVPLSAERAEIYFLLQTLGLSGVEDISFGFRLFITCQPAKFVPGLGA